MITFLLTMWRFVRAILRSIKDPEFQALFFLVALTLLSGTLFYRKAEGWSLVDSLYFSVITLTTVGYGDLAPTTAVSKIFTVAYLFIGIGIILLFIDAIANRSMEGRGGRSGRNRRPPEPGRDENSADEEKR